MATLSQLMFQNASKAISEGTPDIAGSIQQGAQLAFKKQALDNQRASVENQKNILLAKQDGKNLDEIKILTKPNVNPKMRRLLAEHFQRKATERGTSYHPDFMKAIVSADFDPTKVSGLVSRYQTALDGAVKTGEFSAELAELRGQVAAAIYEGDITKLLDMEQQSVRAGRAVEAANVERGLKREDLKAQRFDSAISEISKDVEGRFKKLDEQKASTRLAYDTFTSMLKTMQAGKKPSVIEFNAGSRAMAKVFNSGAMTDRDVADFRELTGIKEITKDTINKWFTGNVNMSAVKQLRTLAIKVAANIDDSAAKKSTAFDSRFNLNIFEGEDIEDIKSRVGLSHRLDPTLGETETNEELMSGKTKGSPKPPTADQIAKLANAVKNKLAKGETLENIRATMLKRAKTKGMKLDEQTLNQIFGGQ